MAELARTSLPAGFGFTLETSRYRVPITESSSLEENRQSPSPRNGKVGTSSCSKHDKERKNGETSEEKSGGQSASSAIINARETCSTSTGNAQIGIKTATGNSISHVETGIYEDKDIEKNRNSGGEDTSMDQLPSIPTNTEQTTTLQGETESVHTKIVQQDTVQGQLDTNFSMDRTESADENRCFSTEMDTLTTQDCRIEYVSRPKKVPEDFTDHAVCSQKQYWLFRKQKPDEVSQILIPHKLQTDTECGDYFGASLATYRIEGSRFFRHRLVEIKDGYPAQKMKIQDGDDLVYVNSTFVPELNHTAVLNLFHHDVPVDGKTRLTLILLHKKDNKKRQWYQTSAILMPDPRHHKGEIHPEIRNEEYKELESGFERHHKFRYTISGTALYMSIGHTGVCGINITQGGSPDPTLVWRHEKTEDAPPPYYISRKWALGAIDGQSFICLQNDRVTVVDKIDHATWFDNTINIGTDVWFGVHDIYLACGTSGKFFITKNRDDLGAKFGSHPVDGYDCVDCSNDCSRAEGNDATSESSDMEVTEVTPKGCNDSGYASPYGSQEQPTENNQCLLQSFASQNSIEIDG
ncbi:uncharacterized protein LOC128219886 isoform X1 [Mya arenaria]|uniref:uncharacterized protein LOC128219886 isoform X1 n=1 Tax=Mya arenaria TaxID=6604 RepID=UPI0022E25D0A|nr:uncharacterized protein LOC128219886 isoform X1 [Mya arenaria]XP_052783989.1 uncharacterized protein LOC128219886 isoform X1 [Mya arenaria]